MKYMNENFSEDIIVADLADRFNLSEGYFYRQFKNFTGESPLKYLNSIRIKKAVFYLENTRFPVKQIANMCGFHDPYYFSRAFSKALKVSPQQYRKAMNSEK
jgi:two-component system response regulator YesN